jgi:hypothetical protein
MSFLIPQLYVRAIFIIEVMFAVGLFLIHAQPYDEHERYQRFIPDGCTSACFVGIQPGVTTVDEALKLLQASRWISQIDNRTVNNVSGYISWQWSDQKPDWISGTTEGEIWATQKRVVQVMIYGDLLLGDTQLALGLPDQEVIDTTEDRRRVYSLYTAAYAQAGLMIQSWQPCRVLEPLRRPVIVTYILPTNPKMFPARDSITDLYHTCPVARR